MSNELMKELDEASLTVLDSFLTKIEELKLKASNSIDKSVEEQNVPVRTTRGKENC